MEAVRSLKANLKLQHKPCGWCQVGLQLGEDAAVCTACEKEHHQRCWDGSAGCSTAGCANAPLRQLEPAPGFAAAGAAAAAPLSPGMMPCPNCRSAIMAGSMFCSYCRATTSPDGLYHGPRINAPGATASLVCGIISLLFCGLVFGIIALVQANKAKRVIAENPTYGGGGMATAGTVLGVIGLVGWAILVMVRLSAHR